MLVPERPLTTPFSIHLPSPPQTQERQREHRRGSASSAAHDRHRPLVKWWQLEGEGRSAAHWQGEQGRPEEEVEEEREGEEEEKAGGVRSGKWSLGGA